MRTMVGLETMKSVLWSQSFSFTTTILKIQNKISSHTMTSTIVIEKVQGHDVTEEMIAQAAELFSSDYGIWSPHAEEKMGTFGKICKPGMYTSLPTLMDRQPMFM